jgi:hypothetical protein
MTARPTCSALAAVVALALALAGCGVAAAPTGTPIAAGPTPTPVPGAGGSTGGSSGSGIDAPPPGGGVNPPCCKVGDPILGQVTVVVPQPGQLDPRPVNVQLIRASADGRRVSIELRWWSGVAPCSVLDSVDVTHDGSTYHLVAKEGAGAQGVACDDIAQLKSTVVNLGDLDPGTYRIEADGDAPTISVDVT